MVNEEVDGMKEFELKNLGFTEINYSKSSSVSTSDRSLFAALLNADLLDGNIFDGNSCFSLGVVIKKSSLSEYTRL